MRFGLMKSVENIGLAIQLGISCIEIFGIVFRIDDSPTKSYDIAYMIADWEHHPVTEEAISIGI
jgi:hypothetical protein